MPLRPIVCNFLFNAALLSTAIVLIAWPRCVIAADSPFDKIEHVVVIYQENWSFDGLYGKFPGADGISGASDVSIRQLDQHNQPYVTLPQPLTYDKALKKVVNDKRFPSDLPVKPFDCARFVKPDDTTGDIIHKFFHEQYQINGGKMNQFVAWSDAGGLTMSYYDATNMAEGKLGQEFVMCDRFFHAAYGGSFLNHFWFVAASTPIWKNPPEEVICVEKPGEKITDDKAVWRDTSSSEKTCYALNTLRSIDPPYKQGKLPSEKDRQTLLPLLTTPTIGDRLNDAGITWAWYAGGWDDALAGKPHETYQFHHNPLVYFENFKAGSAGRKEHIRDETEFAANIRDGKLPAVTFIKPLGVNNEHPGYATLAIGQKHVADLVQLIRDSDYWKTCLIVVTYDENGGRWDHVAPPKVDRWGCGTRVPTIVVSPLAKKAFVDHTVYDTTSVLKTIEVRWNLKPLSDRDANASDLRNALQ